MIRALASVLLLGMFPHAAADDITFAVPPVASISIAAPETQSSTFVAPRITASGAMLIDLLSGEKIYDKSATVKRPMGSLTKMMTALILIENHEPDEIVTVTPLAAAQDGSAIGIQAGQQFALDDLLMAMLLPSANDVAYALAIHHSGDVETFVAEMNERAEALGLQNTHFSNPAGFDEADQYSTPQDLAWLASAILKRPMLHDIVNTRHATIYSTSGTAFALTNTNTLLHSKANVYGVKTGTTPAAGECLVTSFMEGEKSYLLVLLGSDARYNDTVRMMEALKETKSVPTHFTYLMR